MTFGTDTMRYNHSITSDLNSQHPDWRTTRSSSFTGFSDRYNYEPIEELYKQEWPDLSSNRIISNKVRVENNVITGALYIDQRVESSAYDTYPMDNAKVGIYFSPTNEVDQDIAEFMGGVRVDDYIGSYSNIYKNNYQELEDLRHKYFRQYLGRYNTIDYFRLLNYFNTSIFKQIKEILPGRSKALTGLVVEPHILNRSKVSLLNRRPSAENTTKEVEIDTQDEISFEGENNLYEPYLNLQKTARSQYYWHDIIYINGVPVRVGNDSTFQQAIQTIYENPRSDTKYWDFLSQGVKNHRYIGCKLTSTGFNISSPDTPDGSPVIEFTETSELIMRTQNPNNSGNLIVE
jgi:hypothetical protein